jgi:hypothetical protein
MKFKTNRILFTKLRTVRALVSYLHFSMEVAFL